MIKSIIQNLLAYVDDDVKEAVLEKKKHDIDNQLSSLRFKKSNRKLRLKLNRMKQGFIEELENKPKKSKKLKNKKTNQTPNDEIDELEEAKYAEMDRNLAEARKRAHIKIIE